MKEQKTYRDGYRDGYSEGYDEGYKEAEGEYKPAPLMPNPEYDRGYREGVEAGREWAESLTASRARIKEIVRTKNGAESERNRACLDRRYLCPWCGDTFEIEYCENAHYIVRCDCRATIIQADNPCEAARECAFYLRPLSEYSEDHEPVAGYSDLETAAGKSTVSTPEGCGMGPDHFKYWTPMPQITSMPASRSGEVA